MTIPLLAVPKKIPGFQLVESKQGFKVADRSGASISSLNPSAALIWMQCDGTHTVESISQLIRSAYDGEFSDVVNDVMSALNALYQSQLITLCGSLAPPANLRATCKPCTYHTNRGSVIQGILNKRGWSPADSTDVAEFAMWAPGNQLHLGRTQTFEWFHTLQLRNKRLLHENLRRANCLEVAPATFANFEEFEQCAVFEPGRLWFVKLSGSTLGRGVYCLNDKTEIERKVAEFGDHTYVIQEGIADPVLDRGRKRTLRIYVMVTGALEIYVHEEALLKTQSRQYDPSSTSREVQVDHQQAERYSSDADGLFPAIFSTICTIVQKTIKSAQDALLSSGDPYRYQLFGFDFLVSQQHGPLLIEVNDWPNMDYDDQAEDAVHVKPIKQRVLTDVVGILIDGEPGRFKRVAL